jgi:hypothetical protein
MAAKAASDVASTKNVMNRLILLLLCEHCGCLLRGHQRLNPRPPFVYFYLLFIVLLRQFPDRGQRHAVVTRRIGA